MRKYENCKELSYLFRTAPEGLLGIELDDELLLELEVDILSCGKRYNLGEVICCIVLKPLGSYGCCQTVAKCLDLNAVLAGLLNSDNVTSLNKERRNSNLLAVKSEVCVENKLTSFLSGCCHTHSVNYVIKSSLKKDKKVCTCDTFLLLSKLIVVSELTLKNAVVTSSLLLLAKLLAVFAYLLASCAVLTGSCASMIECALTVSTSLTLEVELATLTASHLTVRTCISSHFSFTSLLIKRVCA